ncbi:MAG TPA: TfuA-like protein [Candidatus Baltobacteraceae bacterium]|nr:TfuA-like protein [Candidatus Baltobacteraceae bacterium]
MALPSRVAVFVGPSLPLRDRILSDRVTYLAPAARGDVERAAREYDAILFIDGVFHHDLSPSPREVYDALKRVPVFGASSMGALRAVECAPYGAVPLGAIARWYLLEAIDGDDEVAVLVDPQTQRALTVANVNVRYLASIARRRGILTKAEADDVVAAARKIFYMDRSWEDVLGLTPVHARKALSEILERGSDLKRHDARFALRSVLRRTGSMVAR